MILERTPAITLFYTRTRTGNNFMTIAKQYDLINVLISQSGITPLILTINCLCPNKIKG
jgi:hypothetical protein